MEYDSDYSVRLATLEAMGGDATIPYDSIYEIDLAILEIVQQGGGGGGGEGRTYTGVAPISVNNATNKISVDLSAYKTKTQNDSLYNPINSTSANASQTAASAKLPTWNANGQITGSSQIYGQSFSIDGVTINSLNDSAPSAVTINTNIAKETVADSVSSKALDANKYYVFSSRSSNLTITLTSPSNSNIMNEYHFMIQVASGSTPTITLPAGLTWAGTAPSSLEAGKTYEFSVLDNIAIFAAI